MPSGAGQAAGAPAWLDELFGPLDRDARRLPWGFTNESWAVTLGERRLVATKVVEPGAAGRTLARGADLARRLSDAGVPSPVPIRDLSRADLGVVVTAFVEGDPGIELLPLGGGPRLLGRIAGGAWRRLSDLDTSGLNLPDLWSRPAELQRTALGWLEAVRGELPDASVAAARRGIGELHALLAGRSTAFVHGDFVPVNLLVRGETLAALLDLEAARIGEPLLDAAWFDWILRYHHPSIAAHASAGFADAAELDDADERTAALLALLPVIRILEIVGASDRRSDAHQRWVAQLGLAIDHWTATTRG